MILLVISKYLEEVQYNNSSSCARRREGCKVKRMFYLYITEDSISRSDQN
jgi:hypothetical protein